MVIIKDSSELTKLNENKFCGHLPELRNSKIIFEGSNNILICESDVILHDSTIKFNASNSIIFLSSNKHLYKLDVFINNNSTLYIGKNNYFNKELHIVLSEETNLLIGDDGLYSFGIWIRTADPHLIYDINTKRRINLSRSIYIGDHVWVGQNTLILKGTEIDSGSIIGADSVVSGKRIHSNQIWAGNPVRLVRKNVFWDEHCVHKWVKSNTNKSLNYSKYINSKDFDKLNKFVFNHLKCDVVDYKSIEKQFNNLFSDDKINYLYSLSNLHKNRFVHKKEKFKKIKRVKKIFLTRVKNVLKHVRKIFKV